MSLRHRREWILVIVVAIAAAAGGYTYNAWRTAPDERSQGGAATLTAIRLPDLEGKLQSLEQWRGQVMVVNFWATWCAPCREEIPLLMKLQEKYGARGLQLVGIAIDQPDKVGPFAAELGMNFPVLIGDFDVIELTRTLGNRAGVLPYTVILNRDGAIAAREIGAVKESKMEAILSSLL